VVFVEVVMSFEYGTLDLKYETLMGHKWTITSPWRSKLKTLPTVSLENSPVSKSDQLHLVRDWCEEQFGNNWFYDWNDFYFKHEKDAVFFALRWL
jgi:hypothetical protein